MQRRTARQRSDGDAEATQKKKKMEESDDNDAAADDDRPVERPWWLRPWFIFVVSSVLCSLLIPVPTPIDAVVWDAPPLPVFPENACHFSASRVNTASSEGGDAHLLPGPESFVELHDTLYAALADGRG
jgi:hypothetical protein